MSPVRDIERLRAEALRKVGRNVVNFQKIEACLKFLATVSNVHGTASTLASIHRKKAARTRRESLGTLAKDVHRDLLEGRAEAIAPPDLSEIWMSISVTIDSDPDSIARQKRALSALVAERNRLIHHDLVHFDHTSAKCCEDLIKRLDAQNPRILEQLAALKVLIDVAKASIADMQAWVDSGEFLSTIQPKPADA